MPVDALITELLAIRWRRFAGGCPNACRIRYSSRRQIASNSVYSPRPDREQRHCPPSRLLSPV